MADMVKALIDGIEVEVEQGTTIIEAAAKAGIHVPQLCYHPDLPPTANCGVCVVEIDRSPLKRACCTPLANGMVVKTNSKKLREYRKTLVELILANHEVVCPTCEANNKCNLQSLANNLHCDMHNIPNMQKKRAIDEASPSIVRDMNKCIACGRCVTVCNDIQQVYALTFSDRGFKSIVTTPFDKGMADSPCVNCGQCTVYCPTGALREKNDIDRVWDALLDPEKHVIVQEAPSIRVALAEEYGMEPGLATPGKMYAALKAIGFDSVMDTNFTADLTILEEGTELVNRVKEGGKLPLITSCSPGWVKFMETYYPHLAGNVSTAKSPMSMFGALAKTYYADTNKIDPATIVSVAVMPCTAKKFEAQRPELSDSGYQDTDLVLTTREFIRMIDECGVDFKNIEPIHADEGMSFYTGAGTIFGATGGVMEAALRSAWKLITDTELENVEIAAVRGMEGVKEVTLDIPGLGPVTFAVAHGLGNARKIMDKVSKQLAETGKSDYTFIEIMACNGGCVGGGGQPFGSDIARRARRGQGLYQEDRELPNRRSHENPEVAKLYAEYITDGPCSAKSHKLLHTNYFERSVYSGEAVKEATHKH